MGMVVYSGLGCVNRRILFGVYHIGVGFCVARSTVMGNAKASNRGTSDGGLPRFSYYNPTY
jgi:hypothetical protein